MPVLLPKFLTPDIARAAVEAALNATALSPVIGAQLRDGDSELNCHIVVLVPSMNTGHADQNRWPLYYIKPSCLYQKSLGVKAEWRHRFDEIAQCKALQLWHGRNDRRTDIMPHLLFAGDTPWWGGVRREGIVVSCSGFACHIDRMIAGVIAEMCIGLAYAEWQKSCEHREEADFLE